MLKQPMIENCLPCGSTAAEGFVFVLTRVRTAILLVGTCTTALGDTLVVPNSQTNTPGNSPVHLGAGATRLQEIVGSGQFTVPVVITGIRVRSAVGTGRVSSSSASVKVTLSTTQAYPNTNNNHALPSSTFANNVGPDATIVYDAALSISSPGCSGSAPCPFDMAIPFATPFSYDPNKGRLLVDIVPSAALGTPIGSLDGVFFADTISSTVVLVSGDPTQAAGMLNLAGIVLGLDIAATATGPTVIDVLNGASFSRQLCPGVLASIFGSNFGSGPVSSVTVNVGSRPAFVTSVTPTQINVQIPFEVSPGATTLTVTAGGATSAPFNLTLASYAPAFLTQGRAGAGPANVTTPKGVLVTAALPANPGDTLTAYATVA
jgi:IPT/TIG domain-containing protein